MVLSTTPERHLVIGLEFDLEWCDQCSAEAGPYDEDAAPGVPQRIVSWSIQMPQTDGESTVFAEYQVSVLECGHEVATLI